MPRSLVNDAMLATMRELAGTTPAGAFIEVGVYQGGSAAVLYEVAREQGRPLYLFDTFEGIPMQGPLDRHKVGDFADTSADDVRALFPRAVVREGIFPYRLGETGPVAYSRKMFPGTFDVLVQSSASPPQPGSRSTAR